MVDSQIYCIGLTGVNSPVCKTAGKSEKHGQERGRGKIPFNHGLVRIASQGNGMCQGLQSQPCRVWPEVAGAWQLGKVPQVPSLAHLALDLPDHWPMAWFSQDPATTLEALVSRGWWG